MATKLLVLLAVAGPLAEALRVQGPFVVPTLKIKVDVVADPAASKSSGVAMMEAHSVLEVYSKVKQTANPINGATSAIRVEVHWGKWLCSGISIMFLLLGFMEWNSQKYQAEKGIAGVTEKSASWLGRFTLSWVEPLMHKGMEHIITQKDIGQTMAGVEAETNTAKFVKIWEDEVAANGEDASLDAALEEFVDAKKKKAILAMRFSQHSIKYLLLPLLIGAFVNYADGAEYSPAGVFMLVAGFVVLPLAAFILHQIASIEAMRQACGIVSALCGTLYKKSLRLPSSSSESPQTIVDDIVLYMWSVESEIHVACALPLITLQAIFLWYLTGGLMVFVATVVTVLILIGYGMVLAYITNMQGDIRSKTDSRMKLITDALTGIRIVKAYAWERAIEDRVGKTRTDEMQSATRSQLAQSCLLSVAMLIPKVISAAVFVGLFLFSGDFKASTIFMVLMITTGLNSMLLGLPGSLFNRSKIQASQVRLQDFLMKAERSSDKDESVQCLEYDANKAAVTIRNASFQWSNDKIALEGVDLEIMPGELVMIMGKVGSGKTALLHAIMGELDRVAGAVEVRGSFGYAAQEPWIFEGTLKQNVLFGDAFDQAKYETVLEACALESDIRLFPGGDQVQIGQRGVALSGGQKARVDLARAVYHDANIILMDDTLAAVDVHVGRHIFSEVLEGQLAGKTRFLVTNQTQFASRADRIILVDGGKVVGQGTFQELRGRSEFSEFLAQGEAEQAIEKRTEKKIKQAATGDAAQLRADEDMETSADVDTSVLGFWMQQAGLGTCVSLLCLIMVQVIVSYSVDLVLAVWVNTRNTLGAEWDGVWIRAYLGGIAGVFCVGMLVAWFMAKAVEHGSINIHSRMLASILRAPLGWFDQNPLGRVTNRFQNDMLAIDTTLVSKLNNMLMGRLSLVMAPIMCLVLTQGVMITILLPTSLVLFKAYRLYRKSVVPVRRLFNVANSPVIDGYISVTQGLCTIRAFKKETFQVSKNDERYDTLTAAMVLSYVGLPNWFLLRAELVIVANLAAVAAFCVFYHGMIPAGLVGYMLVFMVSLEMALQFFIDGDGEADMALANVERVKSFCDSLPAEAPAELPGDSDVAKSWPVAGKIELEDLRLGYRDGPDALKKISATINAGEHVGVVGRTGSGKSTFTLAMLRLVERRSGRILIDGKDTQHVGLDLLRQSIGLVPQDPVLFVGTIRSNLDPFNEFTDTQLWEVLKMTDMAEAVQALQGGLSFATERDGDNFSSGQRQLLCLARVLLRRTKVLLMDEASSHIDKQTDQKIQNAIKTHFAGCTVINVAHRLETIIDCDRILVFDEGHLVENGSPEELKSKNGVFAGMVAQLARQ